MIDVHAETQRDKLYSHSLQLTLMSS